MNHKQAAKLKIGDRVRYTGEDSCPGTITEANWHAVKIKYDDDVECILHHRDMDDIERLDPLASGREGFDQARRAKQQRSP